MKKILRRITALMCIMTLFITPATALASSPASASSHVSSSEYVTNASPYSTPVLYFNFPGYRFYRYEPEEYLLYAKQSMLLEDAAVTGTSWFIPAGSVASFQCIIPVGGLCNVSVYRTGYGLVYNQVVDTTVISGFSFDLPAEPLTYSYQILITALSTNLEINGYGMSY